MNKYFQMVHVNQRSGVIIFSLASSMSYVFLIYRTYTFDVSNPLFVIIGFVGQAYLTYCTQQKDKGRTPP